MSNTDGFVGALSVVVTISADVWKYVLPAAIIVGATILGRIVELIIRFRLGRLAKKTAWTGDDAIVRALRGRITISSALAGIAIALSYLPWQLTSSQLGLIDKALVVAFLLVLISFTADVLGGLLVYAPRSESGHAFQAVSLIEALVRAVVYIIGAIIILNQVFSINLGPALATLGVAGLAVSLALQSTLTDLISGIQLVVARQVQPGNYVRLSTGDEGYVVDIGWRTTTIRQLSNNLIIIPNSRMTSTILVNYYAPDTSMSVLIDVGVAYDSDLDKVERVTVAVAKEVLASVRGGLLDSDPFIRYNAFADSSINFTVILHGKEFTDQYLIKHEFIRKLAQRYRAEGIEIPFPMRTVQLQHVLAPERVREPVPAHIPSTTSLPSIPPSFPGASATDE